MGMRVLGVAEKRLSWVVALLLSGSWGAIACGSDPASTPRGQAEAGAGGETSSSGSGHGGADPTGAGGEDDDVPVTPGELVCNADDDCTSAERPVCDQVLGCVACQYDWDCPANHRCSDNACFEKHPCSDDGDCSRDAVHTVCDAVQQLCVGCREDADCGDGKRCEASECVAFESCTSSRDCADGKVCDRALAACVACVVDGDCGENNACVHNACVPTCSSDKDCLGVGLLCNFQVGRCQECLSHQDCPEQYFCAADGHCALDVCEQGQTRCETTQQLATCSTVGEAFVLSTCSGTTRCVEEDDAASCVPLTCTPGAATCSAEGDAIERCSADGLTVEESVPCSEGKACSEGECIDVVCTPNAFTCQGSYQYQCNENGTASTFIKSCYGDFGGTCDQETGQCVERTCFAGNLVCDGNVATVCAEDGSGPAPGGQDCEQQDAACVDGSCKPVVCTGTYQCDGGVLKSCTKQGTSLQTVKDCGYAALCDAQAGKCIKPTCTPGAFVCDGNVATRCKADGSGYVAGGTDCAVGGLVCDGGGCLTKACTPDSVFCAGGNPQQCSASGATYQPNDTCYSDQYCSDASPFCLQDKCTAGQKLCNGSVATTCASDGSGPLAGGTDCAATSTICDAGECKAVTCVSGTRTCQGEAVYQCNPNGAGTTLYDACTASEFCDVGGETPVCSPDICTANSLGCNGEVISTCGSNGGSWTSPGADCKASNQVCVSGGTCAAEETATQGSTTYSSTLGSNATWLAGFRSLTSRKLTKLSVNGSFAGLQKVTWVVYEKRGGAAAYDLVYQKVTSQTMASAGPITSPALDFKLEKGKTYAVGVHIAGSATLAYQYSSSATLYLFKAAFTASPAAFLESVGEAQPKAVLTPTSTTTRGYIQATTTLAP